MIKNLRWTLVFLLLLVYMINYLDRVALSLTVPLIEQDLHLNAQQFGVILGSFFFGYAVFNFIGGLAVDRYGPKVVMGLAVIFWSLFCGLTAVATGFYSMLILRVLFGMAEGPICSSANKMINGWFPRRQAATAMGILSAGSPLGGAVAGPIVGMLAVSLGWRQAFVVICAIGLVWAVVWFLLVANKPADSTRVTAKERELIESLKASDPAAPQVTSASDGLLHYIKQPVIMATAFAFFCYNYILFFFLTWFPSYLMLAHGLNIKQMSLVTVIPWVVGFIGLALGGVISDVILRLTGKSLLSRKIVLSTCLGVAAVCVALAGTIASVVPAVAMMSVSVFFLYITGSIYWAIIQDVVHPARVGGVSGCVHLVGSISGIIGPIVTGMIVQNTGKFDSAFVLAGVVAATGALWVLFALREPRGPRTPQVAELNSASL
ncbi:MFS transporter [Silvimonas sp. JCM 19000]